METTEADVTMKDLLAERMLETEDAELAALERDTRLSREATVDDEAPRVMSTARTAVRFASADTRTLDTFWEIRVDEAKLAAVAARFLRDDRRRFAELVPTAERESRERRFPSNELLVASTIERTLDVWRRDVEIAMEEFAKDLREIVTRLIDEEQNAASESPRVSPLDALEPTDAASTW